MYSVQCTYILGIGQMLNSMIDLVPAENCLRTFLCPVYQIVHKIVLYGYVSDHCTVVDPKIATLGFTSFETYRNVDLLLVLRYYSTYNE